MKKQKIKSLNIWDNGSFRVFVTVSEVTGGNEYLCFNKDLNTCGKLNWLIPDANPCVSNLVSLVAITFLLGYFGKFGSVWTSLVSRLTKTTVSRKSISKRVSDGKVPIKNGVGA